MKSSKYLIVPSTIAALILGAGCRERGKTQSGQQQTEQVQEELSLDQKLEIIEEHVKSRLVEKEFINDSDDLLSADRYISKYNKLIFDELTTQNILFGSYSFNTTKVNEIGSRIKEKLEIRLYNGLKHDYLVMPTTTISTEAQRDIDDFGKFTNIATEYLKQNIKGHIVPSRELYSKVDWFVKNTLPSDLSHRRYSVGDAIYNIVKKEFRLLEKGPEDPPEPPFGSRNHKNGVTSARLPYRANLQSKNLYRVQHRV